MNNILSGKEQFVQFGKGYYKNHFFLIFRYSYFSSSLPKAQCDFVLLGCPSSFV